MHISGTSKRINLQLYIRCILSVCPCSAIQALLIVNQSTRKFFKSTFFQAQRQKKNSRTLYFSMTVGTPYKTRWYGPTPHQNHHNPRIMNFDHSMAWNDRRTWHRWNAHLHRHQVLYNERWHGASTLCIVLDLVLTRCAQILQLTSDLVTASTNIDPSNIIFRLRNISKANAHRGARVHVVGTANSPRISFGRSFMLLIMIMPNSNPPLAIWQNFWWIDPV